MTMQAGNKGLSYLKAMVEAQHRGEPVGIYSICSASPYVIEAGIQQASEDGTVLLVESTCNQVNQEGGYTGITPTKFVEYVFESAERYDLPKEHLILGGDHLGPNPWRDSPAEVAMEKASRLVRDYVAAGYKKIHLDASMPLGGDPGGPLPMETAVKRAAQLCEISEQTYENLGDPTDAPLYVIGTEVPEPGGKGGDEESIHVTEVESARQTLESTRDAFSKAGLESAWERVIALVVQPGVEFGHGFIQDYERDAAQPLKKWIETQGELTYEAHSTDYQRPEALRQLVEDHFAILKVGPALTFAFREAVFSLTSIEEELAHVERNLSPSNIREVIDVVMRENPEHWKDYYTGSEGELRLARAFSLSDRIRYYWAHPRIQKSLGHLFHNLQEFPPPMTLISQFLPLQYEAIREGFLRKDPRFQVFYKIRQVLKDYAVAARMRSYAIKEF